MSATEPGQGGEPEAVGHLARSSGGPTVADLPRPFVIAHRGGAGVAPEHTLLAYDNALAMRVDVLEAADLQRLADGVFAVSHDATADRVTNGTGGVATYTSEQWRGLTVDASTWFRGGYHDQGAPLTFAQIIDRYGHRIVLTCEAKSSGAEEICTMITAAGLTDAFLFQSFVLADCVDAAAAGIPAMLLGIHGTEVAPAVLAAAGIGWYGVAASASAATIGALVAAGISVVGFTLDTQADVAAALAKGMVGVFSNQPWYAFGLQNGYRYRTPTATWVTTGVVGHGLIHPYDPNSGMADTRLDVVGTPGAYRLRPTSEHRSAILMGGQCPLPVPADVTITATWYFDTLDTAGDSWCGLYVAASRDTVGPLDADVPGAGYLVRQSQSGGTQILRNDGTGAFADGPIADGSVIQNLVLSAALDPGVAVTSLPVTALGAVVEVGHRFLVPTTGEVATVVREAAPGATAVLITGITPTAPVGSGTALLQEVTNVVTISGTTISCTRTDGTTRTVTSLEDATYRGPYLYARTNPKDGVGTFSLGRLTIGEEAPR